MCNAVLACVVLPLGEALTRSVVQERKVEMLTDFFIVHFKNQGSVLLSNEGDYLLPCLLM